MVITIQRYTKGKRDAKGKQKAATKLPKLQSYASIASKRLKINYNLLARAAFFASSAGKSSSCFLRLRELSRKKRDKQQRAGTGTGTGEDRGESQKVREDGKSWLPQRYMKQAASASLPVSPSASRALPAGSV
ncbi:hypothetical protein MGYG_09007 [Nannizzia gypsea CBS 118893]|uniref:Uncharacterized protein n=1 Tax=Arthroderma gypseum (strain ATCC MYA-4604 / CBS 118893) TaxID=535722 RepID=E4UQS0_ARTGP|nr:hypothetical protein MGYG_09007 [Nannizzia gypsea CBS 118893]EFR00088.1 hypothetical protein MGYG_09007 [Nannizzia gypsea CBS 118893]